MAGAVADSALAVENSIGAAHTHALAIAKNLNPFDRGTNKPLVPIGVGFYMQPHISGMPRLGLDRFFSEHNLLPLLRASN
jgi:hypothetical protein